MDVRLTKANLQGLSIIIGVVCALLFGYFVWPTQWVYRNGPSGLIARVNRFSDQVEYFIPDQGWTDVGPPRHLPGSVGNPTSATPRVDTTDPFAKIGDVPPRTSTP